MDGLVIKILLGGLILAILLFEAAFSPRRRGRSMGHFSLFGTLLIVAVALGRWGSAAATGSWHGMAGDLFSAYFDVLFLAGACLVLLISISSSSDVNSGERRSQTVAAGSESHALALAATLGMMVTAAADDLLLLFLGLELTSISMQILSTSVRPSRLASEAGIKLTLTASAASGFFLMGLALLYGATGTTSLTGLSEHLQADAANQTLALSGMGLLLVGLGLPHRGRAVPSVVARRRPRVLPHQSRRFCAPGLWPRHSPLPCACSPTVSRRWRPIGFPSFGEPPRRR